MEVVGEKEDLSTQFVFTAYEGRKKFERSSVTS
jgi:hypothetical protein